MKEKINDFKNIEFGDIDGLYDPKIIDNFVDFGVEKEIFDNDKFFVIGRKGTGKSALYNYLETTKNEKGRLITNLSFKNFPFEKLLNLSDDSFSRPNQYQSIWRNIILNNYAKLIVEDELRSENEYFVQLKNYVEYVFGRNLVDIHRKTTSFANKDKAGLHLNPFSKMSFGFESEATKSTTFDRILSDITYANEVLYNTILDYLITSNRTDFFLQFDQLDDNFNTYTAEDKYFQCIISLFKTAYDINQSFRLKNISSRCVIYLRSDIFYEINSYDAESARWENYCINLNWAIKGMRDWNRSKLELVINKRVSNSLNNKYISIHTLFDTKAINLRGNNGRLQKPFKFIVHRSFHRPRDIIQFYKHIQLKVIETGKLDYRTIKDAEKDYSLWLLSEIENEIAPRIVNVNLLYELLRGFGTKPYSITNFRAAFSKYKSQIPLEADELLEYLYSVGVIFNINPRGIDTEIFSIIRNDRSKLNRDLKIITHEGFYVGLYTSKFLGKS